MVMLTQSECKCPVACITQNWAKQNVLSQLPWWTTAKKPAIDKFFHTFKLLGKSVPVPVSSPKP